MASSASQRQSVDSPMDATSPRLRISRLSSGMLKRERGSPESLGGSHAKALTAMTTLGGKADGPSASGLFFQSGEAFFEETLAPLGDDLSGRVQARGDLVIAQVRIPDHPDRSFQYN